MARLFCLSLVVALASEWSVCVQPNDPRKFTSSLGMEFVLVPRGKAWLGGGKGKEGTEEVTIAQDFYLGVYEVTQQEWQKIMGKNPSHFSRGERGARAVKDITDADLKRFPVEFVSWDEAQTFVRLVNKKEKMKGWEYRLPTAHQWEFACRGGPMTDKAESAFDCYFEKPSLTMSPEQANGFRSGLKRTCKVGSYPPNRLGLCDMHGNVWEWCEDKRARGGCHEADLDICRAANSIGFAASFRFPGLGFRLARVRTATK